VIDIHCHILPAVDDGPLTMQTSITMASMATADGIRAVIATPHTDGIRVNRTSVAQSVAVLNKELQHQNIQLNIYPGYEIPYHLVAELGAEHTLAGSRYVLVEFPPNYVPQGAFNTLYNLTLSDLIPIIAHPERNAAILDQPDILQDFLEAGALTQITATSITGELGPEVQLCADHLLKNKMVHFIATDSHSPAFRAPVLGKAHARVKKILGRQQADLLFIDNPGRILQAPA